MQYFKIQITGIVQGVGFRPFIFRLAIKLRLNGIIINKGNIGVEVYTYANIETVQEFIRLIPVEQPQIAYIESVNSSLISESDILRILPPKSTIQDFKDHLTIAPSMEGVGPGLTLPPDVAVCDTCLKDMNDPNNIRYYRYPFVACAECGPRFTTVTALPYDRIRTTMQKFPLCSIVPGQEKLGSCKTEYINFQDRRFHAQTFNCNRCGPNYSLISNSILFKAGKFKKILPNSQYTDDTDPDFFKLYGNLAEIRSKADQSIHDAAKLIKNNKILGIMGIGGVHIVGMASSSDVVNEIRIRKKNRKNKPFALMFQDLKSAQKYVEMTPAEIELLTNYRRPILLCNKKTTFNLPDNIAPGLPNVGVLLPYAGIHHLLFEQIGDEPLIFTSGNTTDLPMAIEPIEVMLQLNEVADAYLLHNRPIHQRCDDSVVRVDKYGTKIIRRSRGYVPEYIPLPFETHVVGGMAVGPELNSTGAVSRGHRIFPTQHIGNVDNLETYEFLKNALFHMKSLLKLTDNEIDLIVCDEHPLFFSTKFAKEFYDSMPKSADTQLYQIQHHFAHMASLMVDSQIKEKEAVIVASLDGVGYGSDGNVWGGEVLSGTYTEMERNYHIAYVPMIGGDRCVKYPVRMLIGYLIKKFGVEPTRTIVDELQLVNTLEYGQAEFDVMCNVYLRKENVAFTSSCGRFLDSVSSLLGICILKTYEGEPAMRLEGAAFAGNPLAYDFSKDIVEKITTKNTELSFENIIASIIEVLKVEIKKNNVPSISKLPSSCISNIAASVLYSTGKIFANVAYSIAIEKKIQNIGLTGGVAYNSILSGGFYETLKDLSNKNKNPNQKIRFLFPNRVPLGDAGVSIGQLSIAIAHENQKRRN
jgi:hydrogenase maturation protein HypF